MFFYFIFTHFTYFHVLLYSLLCKFPITFWTGSSLKAHFFLRRLCFRHLFICASNKRIFKLLSKLTNTFVFLNPFFCKFSFTTFTLNHFHFQLYLFIPRLSKTFLHFYFVFNRKNISLRLFNFLYFRYFCLKLLT